MWVIRRSTRQCHDTKPILTSLGTKAVRASGRFEEEVAMDQEMKATGEQYAVVNLHGPSTWICGGEQTAGRQMFSTTQDTWQVEAKGTY